MIHSISTVIGICIASLGVLLATTQARGRRSGTTKVSLWKGEVATLSSFALMSLPFLLIHPISLAIGVFVVVSGGLMTTSVWTTKRRSKRDNKPDPSPQIGAVGTFILFAILAAPFLWIGWPASENSGDGSHPERQVSSSTERQVPAAEEQTARPAPSEVIAYRIVHGTYTAGIGQSEYVVLAHAPSDQQLRDLAFDLRERFPGKRFEIVDDASGIQTYDRALHGNGEYSFPKAWEDAHDFAFLGRDGMKWKLVSSAAHHSSDSVIVDDVESDPDEITSP